MSRTVSKVTISLDTEVLAHVERLRRSTGESRSALVSRALAQVVAREEHRHRGERYVAGYREHPEASWEDAARALARRSLAELPWDDA
ncbi:MAG: ribbon-helix-helix protein, CopG family [Myxococcota bacterium]